MPYCKRCGELGRAEKCKKCGTSFAPSITSASCNSTVDRWQSSKYLDQLVSVEKKEQTSGNKKWMERRKIPSILIDKKYRIAPLQPSPSLSLPLTHANPQSKSKGQTCAHCYQQLAGKLVQLPDESGTKYHWSCLLCHKCHQPFQTTSVYLDSTKQIFHPECASISPTVDRLCHHCKHHIFDQYLAIHGSVFHTKCFQCSDCHNVLNPANTYCHRVQVSDRSNDESNDKDRISSITCRPCYQKQTPQNQDTIVSSDMRDNDVQWLIVPQPLFTSNPTTRLTYHSPTTPISYGDQSSSMVSSPSTIQPSDLMSSNYHSNRQRRTLPQFGIVKVCPGCQHRISSVHVECNGPRAAKWHRQCLVCSSCHKVLDSSAKVQQAPESDQLIPTCTTCMLQKHSSNQKRNSVLIK